MRKCTPEYSHLFVGYEASVIFSNKVAFLCHLFSINERQINIFLIIVWVRTLENVSHLCGLWDFHRIYFLVYWTWDIYMLYKRKFAVSFYLSISVTLYESSHLNPSTRMMMCVYGASAGDSYLVGLLSMLIRGFKIINWRFSSTIWSYIAMIV